jgi:hypothetical protein
MFGQDDDKDEDKKPEETIVEPTTLGADDNTADDAADDTSSTDDPTNLDVAEDKPESAPAVKDDTPSDFEVPDSFGKNLDSAATKADDTPASDDASSDLMSVKQEALQKLSPLLSQLDQTPEERFKTLMMMIQASDDQSLVKAAYDAAVEISDEKERAQALLDVVNEINYFTQKDK